MEVAHSYCYELLTEAVAWPTQPLDPRIVFFFLFVCLFVFLLEDFFKVPPSHMKVLPDHYKGPQATSKGHVPLVDSVCRHGKV